ncbi:GNAT family N-acetyltransferase [Streptomyces sp. NPDC007088]|uniref:GNAT family N-acetyltransferase n=1 Tax=Streptomyces sp. NPDC007088 TaxID=3364773 RepID=UPI00369C2B7B
MSDTERHPPYPPARTVDLLTPRLALHPLTPREAVRLLEGGEAADGGYPGSGDLSAARRFLGLCARGCDPRPLGAYEIRPRERVPGGAVGGIDFHGPADEHGTVRVGYGLVPAARGHGYASEALRALLELAGRQGVRAVEADTDHGNAPSRHVLEAAGLRFVRGDERVRYYRIELSG